jgi:predicted permease
MAVKGTMPLLERALHDLRFAGRTLARTPAITTIAVLSLALGIGANTAIFSLIDTVLLKLLPVRDPQRLVLLSNPDANGVSVGTHGGERDLFSYGEFEHIREKQQVFDGMLVAQSEANRVSASIDGGTPEDVRERLVSGGYFSVLGVTPLIGRAFTEADDRAEHGAPYAVLSYSYWDRRFSRSADVLGKRIALGKASLTVIGVAPPGFFGETVGQPPDLWIPIMMQPEVMPGRDWLKDNETEVTRVEWLQMMGRLKPRVTLAQSQANIGLVFHQLLAGYEIPNLNEQERRNLLGQTIKAREGGKGASSLRGDFAQPLVVLMALVGLVLLIACANIANLLLARAAGRQKEIAVRLALGAGRGQLGMQMMAESMVLAAAGAALGLLFASAGTRLLLRLISGAQGVPLEVHPDARMLGFTAGLAILTGILFGVAPALRATRFDVAPALKENARGLSGGSRVTLGRLLVVAQIAISLLLLIGAGLFIRTLSNLRSVDLGYRRENLVVIDIDALTAGYKGERAMVLYNRLLSDIRAIPGVKAATFSDNGIFSGSSCGTQLYIEGFTPAKGARTGTRCEAIGPDYFATLGVPMLRGRELTLADMTPTSRVAVINQTMAKDFFEGRDPIGKHIKDLYPGSKSEYEIVGVAQDFRTDSLRGKVIRHFYAPAANAIGGGVPPTINIEVRTAAAPAGILAAVRRKIQETDRTIPIESARTVEDLIDSRVLQQRIIADLSGFFGGLALLLAAIGLYGVLSYAVARRTNEIGIRMAVGAGRSRVVWMILRETLAMLAAGAAIGAPSAVALSKLIESQMFGVKGSDPVTIAAAVAILAAIAAFASVFPALRAARVDPMVALRVE